jgi:hypothetical protein
LIEKMAKGELGATPLAEAAYEALRALIWQSVYYGAIPAEPLARELEKASVDVSDDARNLMLFLASIARMARSAIPPPPGDD